MDQKAATHQLGSLSEMLKLQLTSSAPFHGRLSSKEKLEFARAVACRGKMNTPEMRAIQNARLAELASIKGKTVEDLEEEIKDTEATLEKLKASRQKLHEELRQVTSNVAAGAKSQADLIFLRDDLKLEDKRIMIVLDKLKRMQDRLEQLRMADEAASGTFTARARKGKEKKRKKKGGFFKRFKKRRRHHEEEGEFDEE